MTTTLATSSYADFLARKVQAVQALGIQIRPEDVHPILHAWQAEIVQWATLTGRCAVWADTGLGKTFMQVEWARLSADRALIIAPLAVCAQTVREAAKLGVTCTYARSDSEAVGPGLWITNYERVKDFDPDGFGAVVLDEASILKQSDGKTRTALIEWASHVDRRLACTATPAPNDVEELTSQAEWVGASSRVNMLAAYFVHDSDKGWRLKGHARRPMMRWMSTWAVALRRPSDMGHDDTGYDLPGLDVVSHLIAAPDLTPDDQLFATDLGGVGGRAKVRRATIDSRCDRVAELVEAEPDTQWLLWCGMNSEAETLTRLIPDAINVTGSDSPEDKAARLLDFADGKIRVLVTKPKLASLGMNFQSCARMAFVGLNDSYEQYYQAIRRCYRYGQQRVVHAHVVLSDVEGQIAVNIARKERSSASVLDELVREMRAAKDAVA